MLDDDHAVALLDERLEHFEQLADILEMEPGGRLVEDVERLPGRTPRQFLGELDALCLAARQRRRMLPDLDIAKAKDRTSVVLGKSVAVRVDLGGPRLIKQKN